MTLLPSTAAKCQSSAVTGHARADIVPPNVNRLVQAEDGFDCGKGHFAQPVTIMPVVDEAGYHGQLRLDCDQAQSQQSRIGRSIVEDIAKGVGHSMSQAADHVVVVDLETGGDDAHHPAVLPMHPARSFQLMVDLLAGSSAAVNQLRPTPP